MVSMSLSVLLFETGGIGKNEFYVICNRICFNITVIYKTSTATVLVAVSVLLL